MLYILYENYKIIKYDPKKAKKKNNHNNKKDFIKIKNKNTFIYIDMKFI